MDDGAGRLALRIPNWPDGAEVRFVIDVDDVLRHGDFGQSHVSGNEIAGTEVRITTNEVQHIGVLDTTRRAVVRGICGS